MKLTSARNVTPPPSPTFPERRQNVFFCAPAPIPRDENNLSSLLLLQRMQYRHPRSSHWRTGGGEGIVSLTKPRCEPRLPFPSSGLENVPTAWDARDSTRGSRCFDLDVSLERACVCAHWFCRRSRKWFRICTRLFVRRGAGGAFFGERRRRASRLVYTLRSNLARSVSNRSRIV